MEGPTKLHDENLDAKNNNQNTGDQNAFCKFLKRLKLPSCYSGNKEDLSSMSPKDSNGFVEIPLTETDAVSREVPPPPPSTPALPVTPVDPHELCLERVKRGVTADKREQVEKLAQVLQDGCQQPRKFHHHGLNPSDPGNISSRLKPIGGGSPDSVKGSIEAAEAPVPREAAEAPGSPDVKLNYSLDPSEVLCTSGFNEADRSIGERIGPPSVDAYESPVMDKTTKGSPPSDNSSLKSVEEGVPAPAAVTERAEGSGESPKPTRDAAAQDLRVARPSDSFVPNDVLAEDNSSLARGSPISAPGSPSHPDAPSTPGGSRLSFSATGEFREKGTSDSVGNISDDVFIAPPANFKDPEVCSAPLTRPSSPPTPGQVSLPVDKQVDGAAYHCGSGDVVPPRQVSEVEKRPGPGC